ncbi:Homeobox protein HD-10, partial [Termitomyces sp. T112]
MFSRPVSLYPPPATPSIPFPLPPGLSMDPSSVDFRAFYPYTPNEVKHRKRTTTTQLRTLEAIFKRDTKPNGPLRVELAAQLGMTARGVQVWFQNRRAKEKLKASKAAKNGEGEVKDKPDSSDDEKSASTPPTIEIPQSPPSIEPPSSVSSLPMEPKRSIWEDHIVDPHFLYPANLHTHRRGSLPVNAFPTADFSLDSSLLDDLDPLARRCSVDASLQRLANNPFAPLARAKNGAIYGSRTTVASIRRPLCRTPLNPTPRITSAP